MCYSTPMRFQERDGEILSAIYKYGGVLARRHLKGMFWESATLRAAQKRLAKLVDNRYLARPTDHHRRTQPIPEPLYWLDWRGILWVAGQCNLSVKRPSNDGENQMRKLAKQLRKRGIRWLREPRWIQLAHDLTIVDFRLTVEWAAVELPFVSLEEWVNETVFRADGDAITYSVSGRDGEVRREEKRVYPDSYFVLVDHRRSGQGLLDRARFLLEIDNATHPNRRFGREKVAPGLAYIKSQAYKSRFGDNSGRWLVVTTGERRMRNLMRQTRRVAGAGAPVFLFTTFDQLTVANLLTDQVWEQVGSEEPRALLR